MQDAMRNGLLYCETVWKIHFFLSQLRVSVDSSVQRLVPKRPKRMIHNVESVESPYLTSLDIFSPHQRSQASPKSPIEGGGACLDLVRNEKMRNTISLGGIILLLLLHQSSLKSPSLASVFFCTETGSLHYTLYYRSIATQLQ
jgi:hypothetical protein